MGSHGGPLWARFSVRTRGPGRPMGLTGRAAAVDQIDAFRGVLRRGGVRGTEGQVLFRGRGIAGNCGSTRHYARGTHRLTSGSQASACHDRSVSGSFLEKNVGADTSSIMAFQLQVILILLFGEICDPFFFSHELKNIYWSLVLVKVFLGGKTLV
jgi:hypothetical protein